MNLVMHTLAYFQPQCICLWVRSHPDPPTHLQLAAEMYTKCVSVCVRACLVRTCLCLCLYLSLSVSVGVCVSVNWHVCMHLHDMQAAPPSPTLKCDIMWWPNISQRTATDT